ncbi:MAG: PD-(D/E)XK nuclease family protein [Candidatus Symbiothrix sp.]|jgi:hypothetical protein|nr:PD-(D/E)XK nuclease family protein [Candidatus Symbiothrix sp.]
MADHTPQPFLSLVAKDLIARFGTDLSDITVVFPNIRAGLFFNNYLYKEAQQPLWAPHYMSIENLFEQAFAGQKGDSMQLIAGLYEVYIQVFNAHATEPSTETIDEFFFFGEVLLNDFDDIDKNLVNARALFSNLQDLDALRDDFTHLSDDQKEALMRRFRQFFAGDTALKTAFRNIWNILGEVYTKFKQKLQAQNTAYPGMLMRAVIEGDDPQSPDDKSHYVFVGFNVLSKCEEQLFKRLKSNALFYWDYDQYYLETEAGRFIKHNIQKFGSALDTSAVMSTEGRHPLMTAEITFLASPSESAQAAAISPWIDSLNQLSSFTEPNSAIVLCNEKLLPIVMHAIPPQKVENVNITMGFPITQTAISSFLQVVTEMQTKGYRASDQTFYYKYVLPVLRHPYTSLIFPGAATLEKTIIREKLFFIACKGIACNAPTLFKPLPDTLALAGYLLELIQAIGQKHEVDTSKEGSELDGNQIYTGLHQESIFRAYQVVNRLHALLTTENRSMGKPIFLRLLRKLLSTVQIPFHGEPVKGLQIMGVLETRTLDFKNLLMLNVNEGFMPGTTGENTFVPQFLREHFGMSTIDHQDSIYAYYFYRLIQRAEKITLVYSTDKTQTGKAEISRFLLQLLVDPDLKDKIQRFSLQAAIKPRQTEAITVAKSPEIMQALNNRFDFNTNSEARAFSPTALNTYINCSYRFYLEYIKGLREKEELADELDNSVFGNIFHRAAEYLYQPITNRHRHVDRAEQALVMSTGAAGGVEASHANKSDFQLEVSGEYLDGFLKQPYLIEKLVLEAFKKEYFNERNVHKEDFNGEQLINFHVIVEMIKRLIRFDRQHTPFTIRGLELRIAGEYALPDRREGHPQGVSVRIGGIIDRLDEKDGKLYIVDYKTGGSAKEPKSIDELFEPKTNRAAHIFQTFVYASALLQEGDSRLCGNPSVRESTRFNDRMPVVPQLLYIRQAHKDDYSPTVLLNKEPITDFHEVQSDFNTLLLNKIDDLFNPGIPFVQTEISQTCEYCSFKELCNR